MIKFNTDNEYVEEYPKGYDDKVFFQKMRDTFSKKEFPLQMKGHVELGTNEDFVGQKFDTTFNSFEELMKWVNDSVWKLNYEWTR